MEKEEVEVFSSNLFIIQTISLVVLIFVLYLIYKIYKKVK